MKGVSPFVATILLVGFTVAVGAIISTWFITLTRTQTTGVEVGTACASQVLNIRALGTPGTSTTFLVYNSGPDSVTVTSFVVTCGGSLVNLTNPSLVVAANSQNVTVIFGTSGCSTANLGASLTAVCSRGGNTETRCPEGTCFS